HPFGPLPNLTSSSQRVTVLDGVSKHPRSRNDMLSPACFRLHYLVIIAVHRPRRWRSSGPRSWVTPSITMYVILGGFNPHRPCCLPLSLMRHDPKWHRLL
ncbi:unnamed protein product, partial [Mycena citricolor]